MVFNKHTLSIRSYLFVLLSIACLSASRICQAQSSNTIQSLAFKQLISIMPDEHTLQGFVRMRPAGEIYLPQQWSTDEHKWILPVSQSEILKDEFDSNVNLKRTYGIDGFGSRMERQFYSTDGFYHLSIELLVCDSQAAASSIIDTIRHQSQAVTIPGSVGSTSMIGDESWVDASKGESSHNAEFLLMRVGRLVATLGGDVSSNGRQNGRDAVFPGLAIQAAAYQLLLQTFQQTTLTGMLSKNTHLAINGHALPKNALKVAGRVYVPVQEFAKAMGLTSHWNSKTGALTLSGANRKPITLTAGSTAASIGGVKASALAVPVLKDGGQPVMTLDDLLKLTGGRITSHVGNTVQVKG